MAPASTSESAVVSSMPLRRHIVLLGLTAAITGAAGAAAPDAIDLRGAVVVAPPGLSSPARAAIDLLIAESTRRTGLHWTLAGAVAPDRPTIVLAPPDASLGAEGYAIATRMAPPRLTITPADDRGLLFGIGHLLRTLHLAPGRAGLAAPLEVATAPRFPLRGMQLGFRAMSNTYGNWTLAEFEQQIRDLAVFGCNAIELVAGFDREAPEMLTMPAVENMAGVSAIAARYGLDIWLWTPAREHDYSDPAAVARTLAEWERIFRRLPRLDGIYVPGGDPGETPPELLLPLVEQQAALLRRHHPRAGVWISVQGFNRARLDTFFRYLQERQPAWLAGVIQSSWTDLTMAQLRERTPPRYPLRSCIDIGHTLHCMYPVQDFDLAFAITQGREPIGPRPEAMAAIARAELPGTIGSIAYSDGVTDDVNKTVWLQLNWDPGVAPEAVLRDYGRYFIGPALGAEFASGVARLERNWQGPLAENREVAATLALFQGLEKRADLPTRRNWRFLSALYRATYDRQVQQRLAHETRAEAEANAVLARVRELGAETAMREAEAVLDRAVRQPVAAGERTRVFQLGEALFQAIGMKLSVPLHRATSVTRGANLDSIDWPLNNRAWLKTQFAAIRGLTDESARAERLLAIAHWTDPGPGGFYDDSGRPGWRSRAGPDLPWAAAPAGQGRAQQMKSWIRSGDFATHRLTWMDHVGTLGATPLTFTYDQLDPAAAYELRVVYGDTKLNGPVRLTANGTYEVHPLQRGPSPAAVQAYALPRAVTATGRLELKWERDPSLASIRGVCHVSEIWLVRIDTP